MKPDSSSKRTQILEAATHYITSFVVFMKGLDKVTIAGKGWIGALFIMMALFILAGTIFHHRFEKMLRHFKAYVLTLEAVVMAIVGVLYVKEGKQMLPYVFFAASAFFVVALIVYISRHNNSRSRNLHQPHE